MGAENYAELPIRGERARHHHRHRKGGVYWCLVSGSVLVGLFLSVTIGMLIYGHHLRSSLTDTVPEEIPVVVLDRQERLATQRLYERLIAALNHKTAGKFEITDRQLNGIIGALPECRELRGRAQFKIVNGEPWIKASLPLDETGISWLNGRYLNGEFRLVVRLRDDNDGLEVFIGDAVVKGGSLPPWLMRRVQKYDLARALRRDRTWGPRIHRLEDLAFDLNKLIIRTRKGDL